MHHKMAVSDAPLSSAAQSMLALATPSPLEKFEPDWPGADRISMQVKRDDLIHPIISGNKWRKLKYTLDALPGSCRHIISFGGGFSNHLHACGYLCSQLGIHFTAIIRGDYSHHLTPMLCDLQKWQAQLQFVDKKTYQLRADSVWLDQLQKCYPEACIIPEGGSQSHALKGVAEIVQEDTEAFDHIIAPVGSGATLAGLITAVSAQQIVTGIGILKGEYYLESLVETLLPMQYRTRSWRILHDFHHGGYGKQTEQLNRFCERLNSQLKLPVEPVYSGKLFFAIKQLLAAEYFPSGTRLRILHTGGLQGAR